MACAYTGSAASNLGGGRTILSMLGIEKMSPRINEHLSCLSAVALTELRVAFQYNRPNQVAVIFIDEILFVTSILLSVIDKHLKEILDSRATYGGVSMILLGDFQQLDPGSGVPLTKSVVDHLMYNQHPEKYVIDTPREEGIHSFKNAQLIVPMEQMQASKDSEHTAVLEQLRNTDIARPVTEQLMDKIQPMVLTSDDVCTNPNWHFAPLAVCGNVARQIANSD
jgi:hypothetical protein